MRLYRRLLIAAAALGAWAASEANTVVENPVFEGSNTNALAITRVELTDTAAIIDFNANYHPHYWIRIGSDSYLESKGVRYPLTGAEGIVLDDLFWMPDSGEADFKLFFKPLPQDTETFTFIEGEVEGAFRIWGISLVGNTDNDYPEGLPEALKKDPVDGPLPAPVMGCGTTKVNVYLLGDKNALVDADYLLIYNTILGEQEHVPLKFDSETGVASAEFDQIGTVSAFIVLNSSGLGELWIAPGETIDIYLDGRINGYLASQSRIRYVGDGMRVEENPNQRPANPHGYVYASGHYSDLNRFVNMYRFADTLEMWDNDRFSYRMTGDEYTDEVERQYLKAADVINGLDRPQMFKEEYLSRLQQYAMYKMVSSTELLYSWNEENHTYNEIPYDSLNVRIEPRHIQQIGRLFDLESPTLLMGSDLLTYTNTVIALSTMPNGQGRQTKLLSALREMPKAADNGTLAIDDETRALIGADVADMMMRRNQRAIDMKKEMESMAMTPPDVPLDELFKAIVSPYKGKVVLIDLWNTWCGPCRAALEHNEPHKTGELASDDLVWIYIANDTSPIGKYVEMISNIKGVHYRFNNEQWQQIADVDFPGIDGIPAYILVDRAGNATLRLDFRDHELMKNTLKSMLRE